MNKALDLLREIRPSIPKEVLELWCKDRDAFIASHPAAEQAGGDERAAFEAAFAAMGRPVCRADYDQDAYGTPFDDGGWTGWQARAALAQPSPVRSSLLINGYQLRAALEFIAPDGTAKQLESEARIEWRQQDADFLEAGLYAWCAEYPEEGCVLLDEEPATAQPSPAQAEQAEAERPEVEEVSEFEREDIARSAFETAMADGISLDSFLSLSNTLAARYERIVGALRAELQAAEDRADTLEHRMMGMMTRHFAEAWRNRDTQKALDGYLSAGIAQLEQQRDAALSEVERLRQFERICEGLPQDAIDGGWTVQGIRAHSKQLEEQLKVALARVAELEKQEPVAYVLFRDGEVYYETDDNIVISNTPGDETDLYRWLPVFTAPAAQAQQLHDLDKQCRDDVARALGLRPSQERGFAWSYLLASIKSCVKASEDAAQAQHSVPEGWKLVPMDKGCVTSSMKAECIGEFSFYIRAACAECLDAGTDSDCHVCGGDIEYDQKIDVPWDTCKEIYKAMLAAAPGKVVGHE
ncbi:hypothetical protein [Pseudomonas aeruginosa]|uniref:hypothetical protein n=1 Tax=Pseudomonas aeruginosa TaxID=287 RepID=UPI00192D05CB|nr:hypothetical protein [Pseudomonas aeruginosa]